MGWLDDIAQEGTTFVPKTFYNANPVKADLMRRADSIKFISKQPKVYLPPKETILRATPEQRAAQQIIKDENAANAEAMFQLNAEKHGMTRNEYSKFLDKRAKLPDVQLEGLSGLPTDGEGCVGSERGEKRKLKKEAKRQDGGFIPVAQNGDYLEKLKKNNPKLYKEVQRNNRRTESTNKWNQHFEEEKKKEKAKAWVQNSMQEAYKHPLMQPGYFTPEGALIGAIQGAANMGPDLYNGEYSKAGMDALMMLPLAPNAIRAAGPAVQRVGKLMGKLGKSDNFLPPPPAELHIPSSGEYSGDLYGSPIANRQSPVIEDLRRAYHNSERFLTLEESRLLNREGYGNRLEYAPQRIQDIFNLDKPTIDKMKEVTQYLDNPQLQYASITDLPLSKLDKLNRLNTGVRERYIANGEIAPEVYNEQIHTNINDIFRKHNRLNPDNILHPRLSEMEESLFTIRPRNSEIIDLRRNTRYSPHTPEEPRNMSGYTKEQTMAMLPKDKADKLAKLSPDEFDNVYITPKGDIVPLAINYNKPVIHDMHSDEWIESFNSNLPRLNKIIETNNTSGKPYTISNIDKNGNIKFDSEFGSSYFNTNITPGRFTGEIEDIANYQYMRDIPGISMANTSAGVFGPGGIHKGTKAYESINTYLKEMELGRVKAGFNSQTQYSRPLWENAVKADKAVGYYGKPGTVHAVMKSVVPGAIGLGAVEQVIDQKQNGGIIDDDNGQWAHPGKVTRINSNNITMQGVNYPVLGVSNTGDVQMMYPGEDYKFKGKKVTEYPMAQSGLRQEQKSLQNLDNLINFTNYNTLQSGGWLDDLR